MRHYLTAMRNYAVFRGRASRAEYWRFIMVYGLLLIAAAILDTALGTLTRSSGLFIGFVQLIHLLPGLAAFVRRMHDRDRSGWWFCLSLTVVGVVVPIVFSLQRGTLGPNYYGPDPSARPETDHVEPVLAGLHSEFYAPTPASIREMAPIRRDTNLRRRDDEAVSDPIAEIERLAYLRQEGDISDAEFEVLKARALSRVR